MSAHAEVYLCVVQLCKAVLQERGLEVDHWLPRVMAACAALTCA